MLGSIWCCAGKHQFAGPSTNSIIINTVQFVVWSSYYCSFLVYLGMSFLVIVQHYVLPPFKPQDLRQHWKHNWKHCFNKCRQDVTQATWKQRKDTETWKLMLQEKRFNHSHVGLGRGNRLGVHAVMHKLLVTINWWKIWIDFGKMKFHLNEYIEWHCMELELNWIKIQI